MFRNNLLRILWNCLEDLQIHQEIINITESVYIAMEAKVKSIGEKSKKYIFRYF